MLFVLMSGVVLSAFCSLFVGAEYSDGTIRNKIAVGHSRAAVYLANLVTCSAAGVLICLGYIRDGRNWPAGGGLCLILRSLFQILSAKQEQSRGGAGGDDGQAQQGHPPELFHGTRRYLEALACGHAMFLISFLTARLGEPEFTVVYDELGRDAAGMIPNPGYLQPIPRSYRRAGSTGRPPPCSGPSPACCGWFPR